MSSFAADYNRGIQSENETLIMLRQKAAADLEKTDRCLGQFCPFDYISRQKQLYIELKTRNITKDKFDTTLIPHSKWNIAIKLIERNPLAKVMFLFRFIDGYYYLLLNAGNLDIADLISVKPFVRHKRSDFDDKKVLYAHIPCHLLEELD